MKEKIKRRKRRKQISLGNLILFFLVLAIISVIIAYFFISPELPGSSAPTTNIHSHQNGAKLPPPYEKLNGTWVSNTDGSILDIRGQSFHLELPSVDNHLLQKGKVYTRGNTATFIYTDSSSSCKGKRGIYSFEIKKGEIFGILGPNGSGKTTTLGMVMGVTLPKSGSFQWFEGSYGDNARTKIGAILESPIFYPYMSALDNLKIVAKIKKQDYSDIDRVLKQVELYDRRKSPFKTFSLGMKQRLAIAAALIGNPEALILDEPTNGLDPQGIADIRNLILKIASEGVSIILASHLLDEVQKVCTHVLILNKGNRMALGKVDEILQEKHLLELKADDMETLRSVLSQFDEIEKINEENEKFIVALKPDQNTADIHKKLIEKQIILTHLLVKEKSLEKFFLEI